ncbi:hypothetical protein F5Y16DRAFT_225493 [Xylariaceae sp. FL0255]|nr:hypothetical protein F5Y16DRAFT_225493 [Xylariaceae sp. FL0255]
MPDSLIKFPGRLALSNTLSNPEPNQWLMASSRLCKVAKTRAYSTRSATTLKAKTTNKKHTNGGHQLLPQRSSLRRALTASLLSSGIIETPSTTSSPLKSLGEQESLHEKNDRIAITTDLVPKLQPQRSSLRRAIRASLDTVGHSITALTPLTQTQDLESILAEARVVDIPLPKGKKDVIQVTKPQRSSLRRAIRDSLTETGQTSAVDETLFTWTAYDKAPTPRAQEHEEEGKSPQSQTSAYSSPAPELAVDTLADDFGEDFMASSPESTQSSATSLGSSIVPTPSTPLTPVDTSPKLNEPVKPQVLEPTQGMTGSEIPLSLLTKNPTLPQLRPSILLQKQQPVSKQDPKPSDTKNNLILPGRGPSNNDKREATPSYLHRGWHQIREIVMEARGGLFFVEWEGHDPRTGVAWPGSWVRCRCALTSLLH